MKIMVTGNRPNNLGGAYELSHPLNKRMGHEIRQFILNRRVEELQKARTEEEVGIVELIQGGALGADTIFGLVSVKLKADFPGKFTLETAVPCKNQDAKWNKVAKQVYAGLLTASDKVTYVTQGEYSKGCMEKRNHYMVDKMTKTDKILAIWTEVVGGTYECITYALSKGHNVYIINPMKNWNKYVLTPADLPKLAKMGGARTNTKYTDSALANPMDLINLAKEKEAKEAANRLKSVSISVMALDNCYAAELISGKHKKVIAARDNAESANAFIMTMKGAIASLELLKEKCDVTIKVNSSISANALNNYVESLAAQGWDKMPGDHTLLRAFHELKHKHNVKVIFGAMSGVLANAAKSAV